MFCNYFTVSLILGVSYAFSYTNEVPAGYPITTNGENMILSLNSLNSGITYLMATKMTDSKVLHFDFTQSENKKFELNFVFNDLTFSLIPGRLILNGRKEMMDTGALTVDINFERREIQFNDRRYLYNGTSDVDTDQYIFFNITYETNEAATVVCTFAKSAIWFPSQVTTTAESTMPSTSTVSNEKDKGLSKMAITGIVIGFVALVVVIVVAIAIALFWMKRRSVGPFKKPEPELPSYVASESQQVVGIPSNFECPAGDLWRKHLQAERQKNEKPPKSIEQPPSKIKLYKDGEYANIKFDSTATAVAPTSKEG
uniref:Uncharacterized protein n=1 Tax=Panagrellus redivivus TaxID=6233 RepID=A0A7E4VJ91_PANRE